MDGGDDFELDVLVRPQILMPVVVIEGRINRLYVRILERRSCLNLRSPRFKLRGFDRFNVSSPAG